MPVVVTAKYRYSGSITPANLNEETTVLEVAGQSDDYMVEGYLDISSLGSGDAVEVREYISVDGVDYKVFTVFVKSPPIDAPVIRFHTKTLLYNMKYKVTVKQTSGTLRSFPYAFVVEVVSAV